MSDQELPAIPGYRLIARRSDGFIEAEREDSGSRVLMRIVTSAIADPAARKAQFQRDCARARALGGEQVLKVEQVFETEDSLVLVLSHFEGRTLTTHLAREHSFTFKEAARIGLAIARTMARSRGVHGALTPSNVLYSDTGEIRVAPMVHTLPEESAPPLARDVRQLALLIAHLTFGRPVAGPEDEPRVLAGWVTDPAIPPHFRRVLNFMLGPAGPHYRDWRECVRDLEGAWAREVPGENRLRRPIAIAAALVGVTLLTSGAAWYWQNRGTENSARTRQNPAAMTSPDKKAAEGELAAAPSEALASGQGEAAAASSDAVAMEGAAPAAGMAMAEAAPAMSTGAPISKPAGIPNAKPAPAAPPRIPRLRLSSGVAVGDPDYAQLITATKWMVENGEWARYLAELNEVIAEAAGMGPWNQHSYNLERILAQRTPSMMLAQATVAQAVGPAALKRLAGDSEQWEFLSWMFTNPRAMQLLAATLKPQDKSEDVLRIWRSCWNSDRAGAETYMPLAIAVAVVFDEDVRIRDDFFGTEERYRSASEGATADRRIDPVERYTFYRECAERGALRTPIAQMEPHELIWVVDAPVPTSELQWAQKHVNLNRRNWGQAYGMIRYRMDKAAGGREIYERYTLAEIEEEGGICGDQAYFAAISAKANGIPAMVIGGEGSRGAHAWVGYQASRTEWDLEAGRFTSDGYAAGNSTDPQTRRGIKEHELHQLTAPERRTDGWMRTERYLQLFALLRRAEKTELAGLALEAAVRTTPKHLAAWHARLDDLVATKVAAVDWQREIARMRTTFQKYPDITSEINKRETAYLASVDSEAALKSAQRQTDRLQRKQGDRTDLIVESIFAEVSLAEKGEDAALPGRIFREALRRHGADPVAFRSLAPRYHGWARGQGQGRDALRDIERTFDRNFDEPTEDYFAMGAYRDSMALLLNLYQQEGLEVDVRRMERRLERMDKRREDIGASSRRAERPRE